MTSLNLIIVISVISVACFSVNAQQNDQSAVSVLQEMFETCLRHFRIDCVKPKALRWLSETSEKPYIKVTEDFVIGQTNFQLKRDTPTNIVDKVENFLETHEVIVKAPAFLQPYLEGRSLQQINVPFVETGRSSSLVKKVILPFLIGLKFKTAVLVPIALGLIALKTWKALTLGLLSLVLTGVITIFNLTKSKAASYEVVHHPHYHHHAPATPPTIAAHYLEPLALNVPVPIQVPVPVPAPVYGRQMDGSNLAYSFYNK